MDTQSIILTVAGALYTVLMSIVGYLIHGRVSSIDDTTKAIGSELRTLDRKVVDIGTEVVEIKTTQGHHTEKIDDFCERMDRVETHVMNTERIAVMEKDIKTLTDEVKELRAFRHSVNEKQHEVFIGINATLAQLAELVAKVTERLSVVEKLVPAKGTT